jgi:hypothetical protein
MGGTWTFTRYLRSSVLVAMLSMLCTSCGQSQQDRSEAYEAKRQARKVAVERTLDALATRHNAEKDWAAFHKKKGDFSRVFTTPTSAAT